MAALLRLARIFKEPMISRNLFGKPVKCIGTTSCLQTAKYKYSDKLFKQTLSFSHFSFSKLFRIVFAGPYTFLVGPYAFFRPITSTRTALKRELFLMVFQGNCARGRMGHMIILCKHKWFTGSVPLRAGHSQCGQPSVGFIAFRLKLHKG